jgi:drug/metabolite transporter (DMT)-like permease
MKKTSDLSGIAAMLAATAVFVMGDCFMKLVAEDLPPFEVLFLRGLAASVACAVLLAVRGEWGGIAGIVHGRVLLRAAAETVSVLCYIVALARMPIADVIAILQTAPLILIVAAAVLLRERVGPARIALVLLGFVGAIMVAQPNAAGVSPAALLAFAAAMLIAARDLIGRNVPARIPVSVIVLATSLMVTAVAGAMSYWVETSVAPSRSHLAYLAAAGLLVTLGHAGLLLAYRIGRTAVIAPFFYSFAVWALVAGVVVWGALPNPWALSGIALIVMSGVGIIVMNRRRSDAEAS